MQLKLLFYCVLILTTCVTAMIKAESQLLKSTEIKEGALVEMRGFPKSDGNGNWVLSSAPDLKSCCLGLSENAEAFIELPKGWTPTITDRAITLGGTLRDLGEGHVPRYALEGASMREKDSSFLLFLFIAGFIAIAIAVGYALKRNK